MRYLAPMLPPIVSATHRNDVIHLLTTSFVGFAAVSVLLRRFYTTIQVALVFSLPPRNTAASQLPIMVSILSRYKAFNCDCA